jgi:ADP-heptose:LPS heptosyltransferase
LSLDPNNNSSKFNLSCCYFANLDFENAFKFYEYRKEKTLPGERLKQVNATIKSSEWKGENLDNKIILILAEQGIGDNIQFFRYLYWINEKYNVDILFFTDEKISHLFKSTPFKIITNLNDIGHIDYHKLLLSLPEIYYKEKNNFHKRISYIKPNNDLVVKWKSKLKNNNKPIVALNWQGDKNFAFDSTRSISLSFFNEILKINRFSFISLQKGYGVEQIKINNFNQILTDLSSEIDNNKAFEDTIAILMNVDFFITSDTALCHLACTWGVKTYLLLENNPDWRWYIENEYKCFYPNLNIIQQSKPGDWISVFNKLKNLLI